MKSALLLAVAAVGLLVGARSAMADNTEPTFDDLDKNHDGVLSKDEVAAMFPATNDSGSGAPRGAAGGSGFGGRGGFGGGGLGAGGGGFGGAFGGGGHGGHGGGMPQGAGATRAQKAPNIDEIFKSWDKDGNGTISREEFDARPHKGGGRKHGASSADDQRAPPSL